MRLDWIEGKLFHNGEPLGVSDELEAARVMLARNLASRDDKFTTYRGEMPCFTAGFGWAADRRVRVNKSGTPIFVREGRQIDAGQANETGEVE
jgi:hypothetical protein